jgi:hypothetical protein
VLGLPHPHRPQFGLPYAKVIEGVSLCAVLVAGSYPLTGGGYLVRHLDQYLKAENSPTQDPPVWCYGLPTKHAQGLMSPVLKS